jgi:SAM-dependent methyltransferase
MLERARERSRAEGLKNVAFVQGDAQVYPFEERSFDVAISRFGVMFFGDPVAAFRNIGRSLRPGGRLALLVWQAMRDNEWVQLIRSSLAMGRSLPQPPPNAPGPFAFADQAHVRGILSSAGFTGINFEPLKEPMFFGANAGEAFNFFHNTGMTLGIIKDLDDASKAKALGQLKSMLSEHETPEGVLLGSSSWIVTARRS